MKNELQQNHPVSEIIDIKAGPSVKCLKKQSPHLYPLRYSFGI